MRPLRLVPPLMVDEPIQSFASRVARRHGVDMPTFCAEVGLSVRGLVAGEDGAMRRLSDLTAIDPSTLSRRAFRPRGGTWLFADQVLHRVSVRRIGLAVCPLCLRDDVTGAADPLDPAAYVRAHWLVKALRTCTIHGVALEPVSDEGTTLFDDRYHDLAARIAPTVCQLDRLVKMARPDAATRLETWVVQCMTGGHRSGSDLLDDMPLYAATRTCEMLGVAALFGPRIALRSLADADWRAAGEVGFDVASLGADAIAACLSNLMVDHGVANRNLGPLKVFGSLYRWLRSKESGPAYEPFRAILRQVVIDTIPLSAGTDVLGVTLAQRRIHSLRSAGAETGQGVKDMRRALRARGVLPATDGRGPGRLVSISVDEVEAARADAADSVPRGVAASMLGVSATAVRRLAAAGLLGNDSRKGRRTREHRLFSRRDLATFLDRLSGGVTWSEPAGAAMCDLPTAALRTGRDLAAIATMVTEGRLRSVTRAVDGQGVRAIRVDYNEIMRQAEYDRSTGRSIDEVATELRVTRFTALALVNERHLGAAQMQSPTSRRTILVVAASDVAAFASKYASLSTLGKRRGMSVNTLKARLDASGVVPVFPGTRMRSAIYRIADLARSGAASVAGAHRTRARPEGGPRGEGRTGATSTRPSVPGRTEDVAARNRRRR